MSKDNVIKEDLIAKFYQYLHDMDYLRASETIGILKVFGEKTDAYEVELLFGEKKYDQIIHRYMPVVKEFEDALLDVIDKSELDDSIIPDHKVYEYIAASYSMLGSHDRSWQILAFSRDDEVDYSQQLLPCRDRKEQAAEAGLRAHPLRRGMPRDKHD